MKINTYVVTTLDIGLPEVRIEVAVNLSPKDALSVVLAAAKATFTPLHRLTLLCNGELVGTLSEVENNLK